MFRTVLILSLLALFASGQQDLPTVYEYFAEGGYNTGLVADKNGFSLNGKPLRIISGAIHYWRVHPSKWRDSLRKLRATGANTVETYVAWNLHEPQRDIYDFGDGNNDLSEFLNLKKYIQLAQEEDLLVLLRPGPYICSEFEFGGFPSWLLQDRNLRLRGYYPPALDRVKIYFEKMFTQVYDLQFVRGGPIIGIQIENEYGYFDKTDKTYLQYLVDLYKSSGFNRTLLYTSDGAWPGTSGTLPDQLLMTLNFQGDAEGNIDTLLRNQPDKPVMAMEFWTGWYDAWFEENHHTWRPEWFHLELETILGKYNGSVNFYMFQGGTNFAFTSGGGVAETGKHGAVVTSYDYDAPLTEAGDYTEKYEMVVELAEKYGFPKLKNPTRPALKGKGAYGTVKPGQYLTWDSLLDQLPSSSKFSLNKPTYMENLNMNNGSGQTYGFIVHRFASSEAKNGSLYKSSTVKDFATLMVDGVVQSSSFNNGYIINKELEISLEISSEGNHTLDIMVECMDRANGGSEVELTNEIKGLPDGSISLNGKEVSGFQVFALEFRNSWVKQLKNFESVSNSTVLKAPVLVQSTFEVVGEPLDTYLDLTGWHKGVAFVNGFNIGRYFKVGPQQRLYVPSPLLKTGNNTITIFEQLEVGSEIKLVSSPLIG